MGFKPETMTNKILPALGYSGPSDQKSINAFLAASPAAAAKMGKYTMIARQMVEGKPVVNANTGFNFQAGFDQAKKDTMMELRRHFSNIRGLIKILNEVRQDLLEQQLPLLKQVLLQLQLIPQLVGIQQILPFMKIVTIFKYHPK